MMETAVFGSAIETALAEWVRVADIRRLCAQYAVKVWRVGESVWALDKREQWYEASICDLNACSALVHFYGWRSYHDEWVSLDALDWRPRSCEANESLLPRGLHRRVDMYVDNVHKWVIAHATRITPNDLVVEGCGYKIDRVAPLHTHTVCTTAKRSTCISPSHSALAHWGLAHTHFCTCESTLFFS